MALMFYRISSLLYRLRVPLLPRIVTHCGFLVFGSYIPGSCKIGKGTKVAYGGSGIVIHSRAVIGENCLISPGVVVGGRSGYYEVPVIGDNVEMYPGCKILGPIQVGHGSRVGANSVVIASVVPESTIVAPRSIVV